MIGLIQSQKVLVPYKKTLCQKSYKRHQMTIKSVLFGVVLHTYEFIDIICCLRQECDMYLHFVKFNARDELLRLTALNDEIETLLNNEIHRVSLLTPPIEPVCARDGVSNFNTPVETVFFAIKNIVRADTHDITLIPER